MAKADNTEQAPTKVGGKGAPTPKRKVQEAARKRPLVLDRKANLRKRREAQRKEREREYDALRTGDDRYLPPQHKGPVRRFARDYIDSRLTVGEFVLPIALVALGVNLFSTNLPVPAAISSLIMLIIIPVWIIETWIIVARMKKAAVKKFGADKVTGAYRFYGVTRAAQMRMLRQPKPQVQRGEYPV